MLKTIKLLATVAVLLLIPTAALAAGNNYPSEPKPQKIRKRDCIYRGFWEDQDGTGWCYFFFCGGDGNPPEYCALCDNEGEGTTDTLCTPAFPSS